MMDASTGFVKNAARVLVVENDLRARSSYQALLSHWGYQPVLAEGEGNSLINDAKEKARKYCCHLALIDLRLLDDFDEEDLSGLDLAEDIKPAVPIILSGHGNQKVLSQLLRSRSVTNFVNKGDGPEAIKQSLKSEAPKVCIALRDIQIQPDEILRQIIDSPLGAVLGEYPDQVTDVLGLLFPAATTLKLEKLDAKQISSDYSTVPRLKSVLLKVYEDKYEPVVVKLARAKKIKKDLDGYKNHIHKQLVGNFTTRLENSSILWDIGGSAYSYVGDFNVRIFSRYFGEESIENIHSSLKAFFDHVWAKHYHNAREISNVSLFDLYCKVWDRDWYDKRVLSFESPDPAELMGEARWEKIHPIDPIQWLIKRIAENKENDASWVAHTKIAVTHGDLHADNLLVDENQNAWVIDFERSGEGHALQDFTELESDILNRLTANNVDMASFYRLCLQVTRQREIGEFARSDTALADPEIQKVLKTISILRALAWQCTGISDARQYLLGLLFNTIFRATLISDGSHKQSQQRALMLASIICHRLEHWDKPWPPEEWKTL